MNDAPAPIQSTTSPALIASVLAEAVPYLGRYAGKTVVVKYGGHAMGAGGETFAKDVVLLRQVGINRRSSSTAAGRRSTACSTWLGIKSRFYVNGLGVTDSGAETMEVVEMVARRHHQQAARSPRSTRPAAAPSGCAARTAI